MSDNKDYSEEIERGRVVRGYMVDAAFRSTVPSIRLNGPVGEYNQPVLLILPPQPLEIQGYVCDIISGGNEEMVLCKDDTTCNREGDELKEVNCRPVTLIEKP